jgi:cell division transport system permease protein
MKKIQKKRDVKYILNDIPLEQESSRRHLPILMCLLVYLLIIVLATATSISGSLKKWQNTYTQKVTIQIIPNNEKSIDINRVLEVLPTIKGIISFKLEPSDTMLNLLKPWVGDINTIKDIKLPTIIDVELSQDKTFDILEAERTLKEIAPNVLIEPHAKLHAGITSLFSSIQIISYGIIIFILLAIFIIVSVTTRASLNIHKSTVDVLRLMGARNRYISSYFQNSSFYLCLKGSLFGLILSIPTFMFLGWISKRFGTLDIFTLKNQIWFWLFILLIPFIVSFLSMFISKLSVSRMLMRMDS